MYPQLTGAASRLAPLLQRLNTSAGRMFGSKMPDLESLMDVNAQPVGPQGPRGPRIGQVPNAPLPPMSGANGPVNRDGTPYTNGHGWTPSDVVRGSFDALQAMPMQPLPSTDVQPLPQPGVPADPSGAPQVPMPQPQPAAPAPQAPVQEDTPWYMRNAMMQTDPSTGMPLDPTMAAEVRGPDLIQKFMRYMAAK